MKNRACYLDSLSKRYDARYKKNNWPFVLFRSFLFYRINRAYNCIYNP